MIAVRRLIIFVAQILALIFIVVATLGGALFGDGISGFGNVMVIQSNAGPISLFGALAGFFFSTMLAAVFFVFVEIAHNTRNPFNT